MLTFTSKKWSPDYSQSESSNILRDAQKKMDGENLFIISNSNLASPLKESLQSVFEQEYDELDNFKDRSYLLNSFAFASEFVPYISKNSLPPMVYVDGDLDLCFDWIKGKSKYLSISIGGHDLCHWAKVIDGKKTSGKGDLSEKSFSELKELVLKDFAS